MMRLYIGLTTLLLVVLDQWSKYLVQKTMYLGQSISLLGDLMQLTYIRNPGAAFGLRLGNRPLFILFSLVACTAVIYYLIRLPQQARWDRFALTLILGGAIGNLIDRIRFGAVTDFIDLGYGGYRWPVFNVADTAVSVGIILLLLLLLTKTGQREHGQAYRASGATQRSETAP